MWEIFIVRTPVTRAWLKQRAALGFGEMVKAVADCKRNIMAIGGELHVDEEQKLLEDGSLQEDLWGLNLYPDDASDTWIEYDSMVNIRPRQNNRTRGVQDPILREKIQAVVDFLVLP